MNAQNETVGQNIRLFRDRLGFSQANLADFLGIAREQISYYENGTRNVPLDYLQKLADLFGIDAYDLLETDSGQQQVNVALAFRADDLTTQDLESMAAFRRVVNSYLKMQKALSNES